MKRLDFALLCVALLTAGSACAAGAHPGGAPATDHNTLTPEKFSQRQFNSAFEAIEALRPSWLSRRAPGDVVQVYVDEIHLGGAGELRTIRMPSVAVIRHLDGIQATARYGRDHEGGAILVTTRAAVR
jgi:hypothetical protein